MGLLFCALHGSVLVAHSLDNILYDVLYLLGSAVDLVVQHLVRTFEVDHHRVMMDADQTSLLDEVVFPLPKTTLDVQLLQRRELVELVYQLRLKNWHIEELARKLDMPHVLGIHRWSRLSHCLLVNVNFAKFLLRDAQQCFGSCIGLADHANLQPLRLCRVITNYGLEHLSCGDSDVDWQLKGCSRLCDGVKVVRCGIVKRCLAEGSVCSSFPF